MTSSYKELQQQLNPREEPENIEADRVGGWRAPNQPRRINNKRNRGYRRESFPNIEQSEEEQEKKKLLGSQLLDSITASLTGIGQSIVEASQDDPDTWTDDAIRLGLGGAKNVGNVLNAPGIKQALQALGAPAWIVGQGLGWTLEKAGVDPRYGHIAGEVGEWFIPFYGAGKLVKKAKGLATALNTAGDLRPRSVGAAGRGTFTNEGFIAPFDPERLARIKNLKTELIENIELGIGTGNPVQGVFDGTKIYETTRAPSGIVDWRTKTRARAVTDVEPGWAQKADFDEAGEFAELAMKQQYPDWDIPLDRAGHELGWRDHHTAPVKQLAQAINGLTVSAKRQAVNYIAKKVGFRLGMSPTQLSEVPHKFHGRMHRTLNDILGTRSNPYSLRGLEEMLNLPPGKTFSDLELWERKKGFDIIASVINETREDLTIFYRNLAIQSDNVSIVDPDVLVDSMEEMLRLNQKFKDITEAAGKTYNTSVQDIISDILGQNKAALNFVTDQLPAEDRAIRNAAYRLYTLEGPNEAKAFVRAYRQGTDFRDPNIQLRPED